MAERERLALTTTLTLLVVFIYDEGMTNSEFIKRLATKNRRPQKHYQEALHEIIEEIQEQLAARKEVQFTGFGTFYTRTIKERTSFNIKTRKKEKTPAVQIASFRPGQHLKDAVRKKSKAAPAKKSKLKSLLTRKPKKAKK